MHLSFILTSLFVIVGANAGLPEDLSQIHLPSGVSLGISSEQLKLRRPQAIKIPPIDASGVVPDGVTTMIEAPAFPDRVAYWYRFHNNKLGAITKSVLRKPTETEDDIRRAVQAIFDELALSYEKGTNDQILRSGGGNNVLLTAQLWEDRKAQRSVYFVASNEERTIILFDPKIFDKRNFFVGPDRLKDFQAMSETSGIPKSSSPPVDILSTLTIKGSRSSKILTRNSSDNQTTRRVWFWKILGVLACVVIFGGLFAWSLRRLSK